MLETPGVDEIFDLYVAYGMAECLVRKGIEDFELIPLGNKYKIVAKEEIRDENALKNGLIDALEEMLALHQALMDSSGSSEADFSRGANIDTDPHYLRKIEKTFENIINNKKELEEYKTIPLPLMPFAGRFLPQYFSVKSGNPFKVDRINYSLAWVGFHFYTPYIKYTEEGKTSIHIYALIPLESLNALEILALKDLKEKLPHYTENFMSNSKLALLYHLAHTETLGALEVLTKKSFSLKAYTLNKEKNNQTIRYFDTQNIGKLMKFLWMLKRKSVYHAIKFIDDLLLRVDSEAGLSFVDAVLFDEVDGFYKALRIAKRSKVNVPRKVVEGIQEYINVLG